MRKILIITLIINSLLAIASISWHIFLHLDPNSPIYNPLNAFPVLFGIIFGIIDIGIFFLYLIHKLVGFIGNTALVVVGSVFMLIFVFLATPFEAISLESLLAVDFLNGLLLYLHEGSPLFDFSRLRKSVKI